MNGVDIDGDPFMMSLDRDQGASTYSVLIVDDSPELIRVVRALLASAGYTLRTASSGAEALRVVHAEPPDLILLDVMMAGVDGYQVCRALKQDAHTRLIPIVLVTGLNDSDSRVRGIEAGADDFVSKPFSGVELRARVRSLLRLKRYTDDLDDADAVIVSLALTIEARDATTAGHCRRLAQYGAALSLAIGLEPDDVAAIARGGALHDIGKIGIPDGVLLKPGPLTPDEYTLIQQHTVIGDRLCEGLRSLRRVRPIVRHHHEHLDGSGYPDGLRGDAVPLLAQILGIVDVFDAMTTDRPYKKARTVTVAAEALRSEVVRGWRRADLVETFLATQIDGLTQ